MSRFRTIRRQPGIAGGRDSLPACVLHDIRAEVLADRYGVSRSWIVAKILADALGIEDQPSYLDKSRREGGR